MTKPRWMMRFRKDNEAVIEVLVEHGGKTTAELQLANP